jgi:hypothetical protein
MRQVRWRDVTRFNDLKEISNNQAAMPNVRRALSLVVNLIAFMSQGPSEFEMATVWPDDAPADLVDQIKTGRSSGARQRAEEQLVMRNFDRIKLVGLKPHAADRERTHTEGQELEFSHWRIGHFRTQAYGPKMSLRKIIWVQPVRVRPDLELRTDSGGHQYVVQPRK